MLLGNMFKMRGAIGLVLIQRLGGAGDPPGLTSLQSAPAPTELVHC